VIVDSGVKKKIEVAGIKLPADPGTNPKVPNSGRL